MKTMRIWMLAMTMLALLCFTACMSDPELADPEAFEKTEQLQNQYVPFLVGTWHYEYTGDNQRFFEQLTFKGDRTLTGYRIWQTRSRATVGGTETYTDWTDIEELSGSFSGQWDLRYWDPDGNDKKNYLSILATFDDGVRQYNAYSGTMVFGFADENTLCFKSPFYLDENGWTNYKRGEGRSGFQNEE